MQISVFVYFLSFCLFGNGARYKKNVDFHIQAENGVDRLFNLTVSVRILLGLVLLFYFTDNWSKY